jgi:hypothetical protein
LCSTRIPKKKTVRKQRNDLPRGSLLEIMCLCVATLSYMLTFTFYCFAFFSCSHPLSTSGRCSLAAHIGIDSLPPFCWMLYHFPHNTSPELPEPKVLHALGSSQLSIDQLRPHNEM